MTIAAVNILAMPAIALVALAAPAPVPDARLRVTMRIEHGARVVGTPEVIVAPGGRARVTADRPDGYDLEVATAPLAHDRAGGAVAGVRAVLRLPGPGGWRTVSTPQLTLPVGGTASLTAGAVDGTPLTFHVAVATAA